ncbi:DUF2157 domain-containing protein [Kordia jejudonensis]|uniref:DUF2157 domain-containing protein n=1 Tax=Kordia jejudonensis TaxID=1348245 RepID=UPI0006993470|nr:DUF2157 domain-containing protein [Kordia jejudonensis]
MSSKIKQALPELVENGIITEEIAQNIKAFYQKDEASGTSRLFTVFGILGATLIGLGIILIMAHNWDNFSRLTKVFFAFLPMLIGQVGLGFSIYKNKSNTWKETATVFLFFSVGACISLISQIYNIPGNLESFLLAWIVLCLPLLYVTKSKSAIILHLIFMTYYAFEAGYRFYGHTTTIPHTYFLLLLFPLFNYFKMMRQNVKSPTLYILHWLFPLSLIISLPVCIDASEGVGFLMYILVFGILYNIGQLSYFKNNSLLQNGYRFLGSLGTVIVLLILSFRYIWKHEFNDVHFYSLEFFCAVVLFCIACITLYTSIKSKQEKGVNLFQYVFLIFTIIFMLGLFDDVMPTVLINILLFILGVMAIKIGADSFSFGILNYGMLIITVLIACRFFDTNMSFAIRGLLFVAIGAGFFTANYIMLKKQKSKQLKQ